MANDGKRSEWINKACAKAPFYLSMSVLIMSFLVLGAVFVISDKVDQQSETTAMNSQEARRAALHADNASASAYQQSLQNGLDIARINDTLVTGQVKANIRGNATLTAISQVVNEILHVATQNTGFERNIHGNLTDHRILSNISRDENLETQQIIANFSNKSLYNQEHYFQPYFNETFQKIFKALNITDTGSNFTITGPSR